MLLCKAHRPFTALLRQSVGIGGGYPADVTLGCAGVGTVFLSVTRRVGREFAVSLHQLSVGVMQGTLFVLRRNTGLKNLSGTFRNLRGIALKSVGTAWSVLTVWPSGEKGRFPVVTCPLDLSGAARCAAIKTASVILLIVLHGVDIRCIDGSLKSV